MFPGRNVYCVLHDPKEGNYYVQKGIDNRETAMNYFNAAMNYQFAVRDLPHAIEVFKKALSLSPKEPVISRRLGDLYFELSRYEEAAKCYKISAETPGYENSLYLMARCFYEMGRKEDAIRTFNEYITRSKDREMIEKAKGWISVIMKK